MKGTELDYIWDRTRRFRERSDHCTETQDCDWNENTTGVPFSKFLNFLLPQKYPLGSK